MRLHLYLEAAQPVPVHYLPTLVGAVSRWAGPEVSRPAGQAALYSLGWLRGSHTLGAEQQLRFDDGAQCFVSTPDEGLIRSLIGGIVRNAELGLGLRVRDVRLQDAPAFAGGEQLFWVASPVLLKWQPAGQEGPPEYVLYDNERADDLLTAALRRRLRQAGRDDEGAAVRFDRTFAGARSTLVQLGKEPVPASFCPVLVSGTAAQISFAWEVGVGHCTGRGCGALV